MTSASFPRGRKPTPVSTPATAEVAKTAAVKKPSKKRKQQDGDVDHHAPGTIVQQQQKEEDDAGGVDALFGKKGLAKTGGVKTEKKQTKKQRTSSSSSSVKTTTTSKDETTALKAKLASVVTFKNLKKGCLLLGSIRQVNETELLVSLPNKLNGVVSIEHTSDEFYQQIAQAKINKKSIDSLELKALDELFQVGQFVSCLVLDTSKETKGKKIHLTLRSSLLHAELTPQSITKAMTIYGSISSLEDHGAIVNLGIRGMTAFIPQREMGEESLKPGQQLLFTVLSVNTHTLTATLTPARSQVVKNVTRGDSFTLKILYPGMLLNVRVEEVLSNGLSVNFLTFFNGTVEQNHMSTPCQNGWTEMYKKSMKGRARIIAIDRQAKTISLSMAPHIVHMQIPEFTLAVGDVVEKAKIERIDTGIGMLLSLQQQQQASDTLPEDSVTSSTSSTSWKTFVPAYAHISNCTDGHLDKLEKKFKLFEEIKCRIIGFAPFDALLNVTLKQSSLDKSVLRHVDLNAGEQIKGTILAIEEWGILIEIAEGVRGLVPSQHVPLNLTAKIQKKKAGKNGKAPMLGKQVDARVLKVDLTSRKTYLTMKKALLQSDITPLTSYEQAKTKGTIAQGVITKIADYGVVVSFYNDVYGLVPAALLHQSGIHNIQEAYTLGQVVKASVTRCDVLKKRLMLTLDTSGTSTSSSTTSSSKNKVDTLKKSELIGQMVSKVKVLEVEDGFVRVLTQDGLEGVLPFVHLTDYPRQQLLIHNREFTKGEILPSPLLVLNQTKDGLLQLTRKPLLIQAHLRKKFVSNMDDIKEKDVLFGYVTSIHEQFGVFVRFLGDLSGLAPRAFLTKDFLTSATGLFEIGDTVMATVEKIQTCDSESESDATLPPKKNTKKKNMILSFRTKPLLTTTTVSVYTQGLIQECVQQLNFTMGKPTQYMLGSTEKALFLGQRPYGAVFCLSDEETTVIVQQQVNLKEEQETKVLLIDYDLEKRVYYGIQEEKEEDENEHILKSGLKKYQKQKTRVPVGTISTKIQVLGHAPSSLNYVCIAFEDPKSTNQLKQFGLLQITDFYCPYRTLTNPHGVVPSSINKAKVIASPTTRHMGIYGDLYVLEPVLEEDNLNMSKKKKSMTTRKKEEEIALPKYTNSKELGLGQQVTGRIIGIKEDSLEIKLKTCKKMGKVMANVSIVDVDCPLESQEHPFDQFSINQRITGVIIGAIEKGVNQRKPVSEDNPAGFRALNLSLRVQDLNSTSSLQRVDWTEGGPGLDLLTKAHTNKKLLEGVIVELNQENVVIRLSHRVSGICHVVELSEDIQVLKDFASFFPVGKRVQVFVLSYDVTKKHADLSLIRPSSGGAQLTQQKPGQFVHGMINTKVPSIKPPCVMIQLGAHSFGRACITELLTQDEWKSNQHADEQQFEHGTMVQALVLNNKQGIEVSLRPDALSLREKYIQEYTYEVGQMVHGFVVSTSNSGCFIKLQGGQTARVLLRELSDDFIKDPIDSFPSGKLVVGCITKINPTNQRIEMSLKKSIVSEDVNQLKWTDLKEGMNVKGHITRIQKYGVFVKIVKSTISGLCHLSEISDNKITPEALTQVFNEGDYVKAKILKIEDRRVSFGLKPSYFENDQSSSESDSDDDDKEEEEVEQMEVDEDEEEQVTKSESDSEEDDDEEEEEENVETMEVDADNNNNAATSDSESDSDSDSDSDEDDVSKAQAIDFTWDGFTNFKSSKKKSKDTCDSEEDDDEEEESEEESEDSDSDSVKKKKKNKISSQTQKKQQDEWISLREKALSSGESVPQTSEDYERLLAINPQSSYLWIQYMAFHVSMTEIQLARDVAIRATTTISFREEKEKLNVWLAYLNLEHDFSSNGQDDENFQRVFKTACQVNPPKKIYLHLVDLYTRANEMENAQATLLTMQKKFHTSKQIWVRALKFYVKSSPNLQKAAEILQKSFKSLPKYKHLFVISKYGQLLYEFDTCEKARTIFEGILSNYPKRMDLWNVYLDKEIKFGSIKMARRLFERLIAMDFSAKKMKFLFKKFLQFEKQYGSVQQVEHVKQLATAFVEQASN